MEKKVNFGAVFLVAIALSIACSIALSFVISLIVMLTQSSVTDISSSEVFIYTSAILPQICFLGIYLYVRHRYDSFTPVFSKNKEFKWYIFVPIIVVLAIITLLGSLNFAHLIEYLLSKVATPKSISLAVDNVPTLIMSTLFMCLLPAVVEELLFRGVMFGSLRQRFNLPMSVFLSALAFALMHMSMFSFVHQFLLGIILSLLVYYTGSLVFGMVFHFVNNFSVILIEYIYSAGFPLLIEDYSASNIFIILGLLLVAILVLALFFLTIRKRRKETPLMKPQKGGNGLVLVSFILAVMLNILFTFIA